MSIGFWDFFLLIGLREGWKRHPCQSLKIFLLDLARYSVQPDGPFFTNTLVTDQPSMKDGTAGTP